MNYKRYVFFILILTSGCQDYFGIDYFRIYYDEDLDIAEYIPQEEGNYVQVIQSNDDTELKKYLSKNYILLGTSVRVAKDVIPQSKISEFAQEKKASIAITINKMDKYTETLPGTSHTFGHVNDYGGFMASSVYYPPTSHTYPVFTQTTYLLAPKRK